MDLILGHITFKFTFSSSVEVRIGFLLSIFLLWKKENVHIHEGGLSQRLLEFLVGENPSDAALLVFLGGGHRLQVMARQVTD